MIFGPPFVVTVPPLVTLIVTLPPLVFVTVLIAQALRVLVPEVVYRSVEVQVRAVNVVGAVEPTITGAADTVEIVSVPLSVRVEDVVRPVNLVPLLRVTPLLTTIAIAVDNIVPFAVTG